MCCMINPYYSNIQYVQKVASLYQHTNILWNCVGLMVFIFFSVLFKYYFC